MTAYYVDDGGDNSDGLTWAKAYVSFYDLKAAHASLAGGDIVYVGHDSADAHSYGGALAIAGPNTTRVTIISATSGSDPVAYAKSATNQIDTSGGAYAISFTGSFSIYGVRMKSGADITLTGNNVQAHHHTDCTFAPAADKALICSGSNNSIHALKNCTIDLTADGSTPRSGAVISANPSILDATGLSFINAGYRSAMVFGPTNSVYRISGSDFSGFTQATAYLYQLSYAYPGVSTITNCKTHSTWIPANYTYGPYPGTSIMVTNCGPAEDPTFLYYADTFGILQSSTTIYRTGGATAEGINCSWGITTPQTGWWSNNSEVRPFYTPWIYGVLDSTGEKTFTVHITNDTADFTNAEVWLELEYPKDADSAQLTLASNQRATILTTATAQTDDADSTWATLTAASHADYMQKLVVTATVGQVGQYRARVVVGVANIVSTRYLFVDPKVTVAAV